MKKYVNGEYVEMTAKEIEELKKAQEEYEQMPHFESDGEKIERLENEVTMLTECLLEVSTLLYA